MEFQNVTNGEKSREYVYPNGTVKVANVKKVCARPSGSHRLETKSGEKFIVAAGWLAIKIDCDEWSF
jgi:hypothetical protein